MTREAAAITRPARGSWLACAPPSFLAAADAARRPPAAPLQVEEGVAPQQEEKKGKGKAAGKRFEIKKWNAVAM